MKPAGRVIRAPPRRGVIPLGVGSAAREPFGAAAKPARPGAAARWSGAASAICGRGPFAATG